MLQYWNLSYSAWKDMHAFLVTKGKGNVYYVQSNTGYSIVLVDLDSYIFKNTLNLKGYGSTDTNVTDFETNIKPTATAVPSEDDAVAKAVIAAG